MGTASRPGRPEDAILGVVPRAVHAPSSQAEAIEVLRACARDGLSVGFAGGRTEIELGPPPLKLDVLLDTTRLGRVLDYAPSDMVLSAEAGTSLATVQATVAKERQQLSLDPPLPERATVGGIVAANSFGPRRAKYGSVRDLIIGVTLLRDDGAVAHGGGKVVKNVAGFDLPKMACGSLGTLAMIGDVTFRLHPLPEDSATLLVPGRAPAEVARLVQELKRGQLEPAAVVALRDGAAGGFDVAVRFEGFAAGVRQQAQALQRICLEAGVPGADRLGETEAREVWARHDAARTRGAVRIKLAAPAALFERLEANALRPLCGALRAPRAAWYASLGVGFVSGEATDAVAAGAALEAARQAAASCGGSVTLAAAPHEVRDRTDVWGPPPPAFALMRRLKERFDPGHRLNPGRFVGGI